MNSPLGTPSPTSGQTASGGPGTRSKSRSLQRDITPEAVLGMRQKARGGREFRVKLVGRDNRSNRWMAERLVPKELIQAYLDSQPAAKAVAMSSSTSSSPATTTPSPTTSTKAANKAANKASVQSPRVTSTPLSSPAMIETTTTTTATVASSASTLASGSGGLGRKSLKRKKVVAEAGHGHHRGEDSGSRQPYPRKLAVHQYRVLEEVFETEAGDTEPQLLPGVPLVAPPPSTLARSGLDVVAVRRRLGPGTLLWRLPVGAVYDYHEPLRLRRRWVVVRYGERAALVRVTTSVTFDDAKKVALREWNIRSRKEEFSVYDAIGAILDSSARIKEEIGECEVFYLKLRNPAEPLPASS
ncbi:uncharacterized protein ACA1_046100 [Acanthamoeba castellanii str. Neff]|uniref:Uncharacterized protein n=1 Tax=Acanthamoeba castellanii (strain ATCC 30010 / Neff) TaxID=1257118 RepID=L8HBY9_ACACF|nr:uncharacterized protein ACA1_046100 [Acanthamoeba castellanii str. Neff]ELR21911.1 hypothetical protein ACA1_046100 [Acanthamoeba castellanii str. Neff]